MTDDSPLKNLPDVPDTAEELVTLSTDPMKLVAKKTVNAYAQAALAAAVAVPLVASGGVTPTISNVQARKQEDHVPSQSQHTNILEGRFILEVATTSASISNSVTVAQVQSLQSFSQGQGQPAPNPTDAPSEPAQSSPKTVQADKVETEPPA